MSEEKPLTIAQQKKAWRDRNLEYARKYHREYYAKNIKKIKSRWRVAQINRLKAKLSRLEAELEEWSKQ